MSIFNFEDPKALIECSYKIGDSSITKKPLTESVEKKEKTLFESMGENGIEKEIEEIKYVDVIEKKFTLRNK